MISGGSRDACDSGEANGELSRSRGRREVHWAGVAVMGSEGKIVDLLKSSSSRSDVDVVDGAGEGVLYIVRDGGKRDGADDEDDGNWRV